MKMLDFTRSYVFFESDFEANPPQASSDLRQNVHNRARIHIDCHLRLTAPDGATTDYYLSEACKSERVGADMGLGIFTDPNADFRIIMSDVDTIIIKSWDRNDKGVMLDPPALGPQPERHSIDTSSFWKYRFLVNQAEVAELATPDEVVEAVDQGRPVAARTEYISDGHGVVLDYPVTTINVSERHRSFQTDTGPVIYVDFSKPIESKAEALWLAFAAFNSSNWIEFVVNRPTPLAPGISVNHYSDITRVTGCTNRLFAV